MTSKKPVSGRIPPETHERMEEFREERGLNKSDALRELLDSGLEAELSPTEEEMGEIELGPLTNSERWFEEKFERSVALAFLSSPVTLTLWVGLLLIQSFTAVDIGSWLPGQLLVLLGLLGLIVFAASGIGALATLLALKAGLPRILDRENAPAEAKKTAK